MYWRGSRLSNLHLIPLVRLGREVPATACYSDGVIDEAPGVQRADGVVVRYRFAGSERLWCGDRIMSQRRETALQGEKTAGEDSP